MAGKKKPYIAVPIGWIRGGMRHCKGYEVAVQLAIVSYMGNDGSAAFPGIDRLATICGCTARQVRRCIKQLTDRGYLVVVRERGKPNKYLPGDGFLNIVE